jgi:hypothetical protein
MRVVTAAFVLVTLFAVPVLAQHPPNWNSMTANQQSVWNANCNPPAAAQVEPCAALSGLATTELPPRRTAEMRCMTFQS